MTFIPTKEQQAVLDYENSNEGVLLVDAKGGCGKSALAKRIVQELKPRNALYTAFNKAIVVEGVERFAGMPVSSKTFHALALANVNLSLPIRNLSYGNITEQISYKDKRKVLDAISKFCLSDSSEMYEYLHKRLPSGLRVIAEKYLEGMIQNKVNPSFDFILKFFHLKLLEGSTACDYDLVIFDELQDTTAVALEIFKLLSAKHKVGLGDPEQAIYSFMDLVSGFEVLENTHRLSLTGSFRCSTPIAYYVQKFMRKHHDMAFTFTGTDTTVDDGRTLYCTSTNAEIVSEVFNRLSKGCGFKLLRGIETIFELPLAIDTASNGGQLSGQHKHLEWLYSDWRKDGKRSSYLDYLKGRLESDGEVQSAIRILNTLRNEGSSITALLKKAFSMPVDDSYCIATVFTSKGLEFGTVVVADDLLAQTRKAVSPDTEIPEEKRLTAIRCYYVACTRAKVHLLNRLPV
jgi:hypothetical protein